jgi:acetyltransferase-like isoleucine patch superfamily enzyme
MKTFVFAIIFLCPPFLKRIILVWFCGAKFGRGAYVGWFSSVVGRRVVLGEFAVVKPFSLIRCDGQVFIDAYSEISSFNLVYGSGSFRVGRCCYIGPQSLINVTEDITIGNRVGIGARAMIYTHGSFLPFTEGYWVRFAPVKIGSDVWIAAGVFIHPGVEIGMQVFVNSRSVVVSSLESGGLYEGNPAKKIGALAKVRRVVSPEKRDGLIVKILEHFSQMVVRTQQNIQIVQKSKGFVIISNGKKSYVVCVVNSKGQCSDKLSEHLEKRLIFLSNCGFQHPFSGYDAVTFDFNRFKANLSKDDLCSSLYQFMKQYYGLFFEYEFTNKP